MNTKISATTATGSASAMLYPNKQGFVPSKPVAVGGLLPAAEPIAYNLNRTTRQIVVLNRGDRPIQVGSHFHFFEVNRYLEFDRTATFGMHLNIPATTAIRFEPGDRKSVEVVAYAGKRRVIGFNGLVMGYAGDEDTPKYLPARMHALRKVREEGFMISGEDTGIRELKTPSASAKAASAKNTENTATKNTENTATKKQAENKMSKESKTGKK